MNSKVILYLGILLASSLSIRATAADPICNDQGNCMPQVKTLFDGGILPVSPALGDYTGRCYTKTQSAIGVLLKIEELSPKGTYGLAVAAPEVDGSPLDYFDDGTQAAIGDHWIEPTTAVVQNNSLMAPLSTYGGNAGEPVVPPQNLFLRRNGSYFVAAVEFASGDVGLYCYFFKKVK